MINIWKTYQHPGQGRNDGIKFTNVREDEYEEYHGKDNVYGNDNEKDAQVHLKNHGKEEKATAKGKLDITKIIYYNCGLTGHLKSVCKNVANPERAKKAKKALDKEKEDEKDNEQNLLWSSFDDGKFDNNEHAHFKFFTEGGTRMGKD